MLSVLGGTVLNCNYNGDTMKMIILVMSKIQMQLKPEDSTLG